jgi:hypothetical protein
MEEAEAIGPEELGSWLGVTGKSVRELAEQLRGRRDPAAAAHAPNKCALVVTDAGRGKRARAGR